MHARFRFITFCRFVRGEQIFLMKVHNFSIVLAVKLSQCGFEPRFNLDLVRHLALIDSEYKRLFDDANARF